MNGVCILYEQLLEINTYNRAEKLRRVTKSHPVRMGL